MRSEAKHPLGPPPAAYARRLAQLSSSGWICHGTLVCRPLRRRVNGRWVKKGPYYLWTGKRQGKTICYALSKAQYDVAKKAIAANRVVLRILAQLHAETLERIRTNLPGVLKRK